MNGLPINYHTQFTTVDGQRIAATATTGQMFHLTNIIISVASANDASFLDICNNATADVLHTVSASVPVAGFISFGDGYPLGTAGNDLVLYLYGAASKVNVTVQGKMYGN